MYERIADRKKRRWVEDLSENWCLLMDGATYGYFILQQRNAYNRPNGFYKIVKKDRAERFGFIGQRIRAKSEDDWIYYAKRGQ